MTDLHTLMSLDPLSLTKENLDAIIAELRTGRASYNLGNMKGGSTKEKPVKDKEALDLAKTLDIQL